MKTRKKCVCISWTATGGRAHIFLENFLIFFTLIAARDGGITFSFLKTGGLGRLKNGLRVYSCFD